MRSLRSVWLIYISYGQILYSRQGIIGGIPGVLDKYAAVVIAGPEKEFSENDKFVLDQYIRTEQVVWLIEEVDVNADSLVYGETAALYRPLNIEDQLFRYGARNKRRGDSGYRMCRYTTYPVGGVSATAGFGSLALFSRLTPSGTPDHQES